MMVRENRSSLDTVADPGLQLPNLSLTSTRLRTGMLELQEAGHYLFAGLKKALLAAPSC